MYHAYELSTASPGNQPSPSAGSSISSARINERHLALGPTAAEFASNARWQGFDQTEGLLRAASELKAGNIVLPYSHAVSFRSLSKLVAALRALDNDKIRILIREQNKCLRISQAAALLNLGASAILPRDLPSASARYQAQSFEGARYQANFRRDVERVIRETQLLHLRCELSVAEFQLHAKVIFNGQWLEMPHTLVVLHPMTEAAQQAMIASLAMRMRDGVYCVEPDGIWLLLMACRPLDCQSVLERILGQRFESLLMGWRKMGKPGDILKTIESMDENAADPPAYAGRGLLTPEIT